MVELLMTVSIMALLALVVAPLIIHMLRFYRINSARTEIQRDARSALATINRFLRQSYAATVVIDQVTGQPSHSRISFTTNSGVDMRFFQQDNQLYKVDDSTTSISKNLRFIAFSYPRSDDPTIISVAMTMEKGTYESKTKALELSIEKVRVMN